MEENQKNEMKTTEELETTEEMEATEISEATEVTEKSENSETTVSNGKESRKGIAGIGIRYAIFGAVVTVFEFLAALLLQKIAPEFVEQHSGLMSCILVIAAVDVIGFT